MQSKRALWIAEGLLGAIGIIALFLGYEEVAASCVVGIAATLNQLVDK